MIGAVTIGSPYVLDILLEPEHALVYAFERFPNPVALEKKRVKRLIDQSIEEMKRRFPPKGDEEKQTRDFISLFTDRAVEMQLQGEIDGDQIRVWVSNVGRQALGNVTFVFLNCAGYVKYLAQPVSQSIAERPTSNPEVSDNGLVFRYGQLLQGREVIVKVGFANLGNCAVSVDARRPDGKITRGKWVTGDDYRGLKAQLGDERTRSILNGIVIVVGVLLAFCLIWVGVSHRALRKRINALESHLVKNEDK